MAFPFEEKEYTGFHQRVTSRPFDAVVMKVGMLHTATGKRNGKEEDVLCLSGYAVDKSRRIFKFCILGHTAKNLHLLLKKGSKIYIDAWRTMSTVDIGWTKCASLQILHIGQIGNVIIE